MPNKRLSIFGVPVFTGGYDDVLQWSLDRPSQFRRMVTINPIMLELARQSPTELDWLASADLVVPDGEGVCMALKRFYGVSQSPVKGIALVQDILRHGPSKVFFLGASQHRLEKALKYVSDVYPDCDVVGAQHGYFDLDDIQTVAQRVMSADPDYVFVGMGYPRQEAVIKHLSQHMRRGLAIGVGGVIDVLSGEVLWAPQWVRAIKLEWAYRMFKEPRRIRQLPLIIRFLFRTFFGKNV